MRVRSPAGARMAVADHARGEHEDAQDEQKVRAPHSSATPICTCASRRCARCSRTPRAPSGSMRCASGPSPWAGRGADHRDRQRPRAVGRVGRRSRGLSAAGGRSRPGAAGIVLGLEVSRLARNSSDWHRLLEICALTDTLILDEDGLYDPAHFNDRLLLGLKGTMSEAELHVLRARLRGGILNKARRGELRDRRSRSASATTRQRVVLDPDRRSSSPAPALRDLPAHRLGDGDGQGLPQQGLAFPRRAPRAAKGGARLGRARALRALWVLHNPRYAGAFVFGRAARRQLAALRHVRAAAARPMDRADPERARGLHHLGGVRGQSTPRLHENAQAYGTERRRSPPREGPALLQGLVICGRCGERMTVRYHHATASPYPSTCASGRASRAASRSASASRAGARPAIGDLLVEPSPRSHSRSPWPVQDELEARADEADRLRRQRRARAVRGRPCPAPLHAGRSRQPPGRRLAGGASGTALRALAAAQEEYARRREQDAPHVFDQ